MGDGRLLEVFLAFLRQGLTAFGGPIAHLGYFRDEFVGRRKWLSEPAYADLVAMCQFLPGPASSQVGMAIGLMRAGYGGLLAAWLGFTLPSALLMTLFAYGVNAWGDLLGAGWLHGLKLAAVAVVALAVLSMARTLAPDRLRGSVAVAAAVLALAVPNAWGQVGAIVLGGVFGILALRDGTVPVEGQVNGGSKAVALAALAVFFALLAGLPLLAALTQNQALDLLDAFYRAGSLVFGGGHVVLPLLQAEMVGPGLVDNEMFLAGYGAAQAVPGPLFTFAAFLGAAIGPNPWLGALLCTVAIFLPSMLLIVGALPFWDALRRRQQAQAMLRGVNAAVVGLLLAALYDPVWTAAVLDAGDFAIVAIAFLLLFLWRTPPWLVVALCALGGAVLG
jgi:chromate transporter